eukprot:gnl/MRDRNA2_/MRDRNA2_314440_c0_seq1.p2 gnl/MRDRNA2_/MRDRNA2_314440_c0~~gnl/MRDRNA2_/MRDRNA2_314440_c0_seq1.p2  ORF type:complete len:143 (+),score=30.97 gnl/MRDRNA2_/MRDRNA2_314440_c0_seq1:27-431(+)
MGNPFAPAPSMNNPFAPAPALSNPFAAAPSNPFAFGPGAAPSPNPFAFGAPSPAPSPFSFSFRRPGMLLADSEKRSRSCSSLFISVFWILTFFVLALMVLKKFRSLQKSKLSGQKGKWSVLRGTWFWQKPLMHM